MFIPQLIKIQLISLLFTDKLFARDRSNENVDLFISIDVLFEIWSLIHFERNGIHF